MSEEMCRIKAKCWNVRAENKGVEPFFLWWRAPQQMLRTHRSVEVYCATLCRKWLVIFVFPRNGARWNETDRVKPKYSGEKPVPVPLCPPQIPLGLNRNRTRASALGGRRLTAWAMAQASVKSFRLGLVCTELLLFFWKLQHLQLSFWGFIFKIDFTFVVENFPYPLVRSEVKVHAENPVRSSRS